MVLRGHKFGTLLTDKYFRAFSHLIRRADVDPRHLPWYEHSGEKNDNDSNDDDDSFASSRSSPPADYRHVVLTRNVHDSMVSGYLYHKVSGKSTQLLKSLSRKNQSIPNRKCYCQFRLSHRSRPSQRYLLSETTANERPAMSAS